MSVRYVVDERVGTVAVRDTQEPSYTPRSCLSSNSLDVIAIWSGSKVGEDWVVEEWKVERAQKLCDILNDIGHPDTQDLQRLQVEALERIAGQLCYVWQELQGIRGRS